MRDIFNMELHEQYLLKIDSVETSPNQINLLIAYEKGFLWNKMRGIHKENNENIN